MDVTRSNFDEAVKEIEGLIGNVEFISFDLEMTGISMEKSMIQDTLQIRYEKLCRAATSFSIVQFGLSLFTRAEQESTYIVHTYTFTLFPGQSKGNSWKYMMVNCSSMSFLSENGMDFNKWIKQGIPFVNGKEEAFLRSKLKPQSTSEITWRNKKVILQETSDLETFAELTKGFEEWTTNSTKEFRFKPCSSFFRKVLYQELEGRFPEITLESKDSADGKERFILASKKNAKELHELELEKERETTLQLNEQIGFRRIFLLLVQHKKPLVGHNCLMDLLFTIHHLHQPLPDTWSEFKAMVSECFPTIIDTKHLAISNLFKKADDNPLFTNSWLQTVYDTLRNEASSSAPTAFPRVKPLSIQFPKGFPDYLSEKTDSFHEAGFDAFITGFSFAHFAQFELKEFHNCLAVQRMMYPHLKLDSPDVLDDRFMFFQVSGFDLKTTTDDLVQAFACEEESKPLVFWIDEKLALVRVLKENATLSFESAKDSNALLKIEKFDENSSLPQQRPRKRKRTME